MKPLSLKTQIKLSTINNLLNRVQDISFTYSTLKRKNPIDTLDDVSANQLIEALELQLDSLLKELLSYKENNK